MPTVPVYRTNETYQAAQGKSNAGLLQSNVLQQAAKVAPEIAGATIKIQQQKTAEDAAPIIAQASTSIELQLNKALNDAKTQMQPGGKGFAQDYSSTANEILQANLANITNPVARRTLQTFGQQQITRFGQSAQDLEAREATDYQNQQYVDGINGSAQIVGADPDQYERQLAHNQDLINVAPLDPESKRNLLNHNQTTLSNAAALAAVQNDPRGVVSLMTGHSTTDAPGNPDDPRGIRNNNPLNVRKGAASWEGATPGPDQDYERFSSPEAGLRAGMMNARHQSQKNGATTLNSLIPILAPKADGNDTDAYIKDMAAKMGIGPDAKLDLSNKATLSAFGKAVTSHENGKQPYSDEQIEMAADSALSGAPIDAGSSVASEPHDTAPAWVKALSPAQRQATLQRAQAQIAKQQTQFRSSVTEKMGNDIAALHAGIPVQSPLSSSQILSAFPDYEAHDKLAQYESAQQTQRALGKFAYMSNGQIKDYMAKSLPAAEGPGMKAQLDEHNIQLQAAQKIIHDRSADPIDFAQKSGLANVTPLDYTSPDALAKSVASRVSVAQTMQGKYGADYHLLTSDETNQFAQTVASAAPDQKIQYLGSLMRTLKPNDYDRVTAAIKQVDPVTEYAAVIVGAGRPGIGVKTHWFGHDTVTKIAPEQVARIVAKGQDALHPVKGESAITMPSDDLATGIGKEFNDKVGDAFAGDPDGYSQAFSAYKAAYAGLSIQDGKPSKDVVSDRGDTAANYILGDVGNWNGHKVIPPYGMAFNDFKKAVHAQWDSVKDSVPHGGDIDIDGMTLQRLRSGGYSVANGTSLLYGTDGNPVVIQLGPR